jgi:hypothetical protein
MKIAAALIALLALAGSASAHPPGTTAVDLTLHADTFDVALVIDPDALRLKESALGRPLADLIDVSFDGRRAAVDRVPSPSGSADRSLVLLRGCIPGEARTVTWSSSLIYGAYPVTFLTDGREASVQWLSGFDTATYQLRSGAAAVNSGFLTYLRLGFTHIVPDGFDHILFVLGLFLLTRRARSVLAQVSAFTVAHSITLGLSLYGVVSLPASVVEPLIALSIAYIAVENLFTADVRPWRLALVFAFGLLHGLGFADALSRLHLPRASFLATLLAFNAGVELGQLSVIAAAALVLYALHVPEAAYRRRVAWPASAAIALAGLFWTAIRLV